MPDAYERWICCDSDDCSVRWYHWECVGVMKTPSGYWLCPWCSPKAIQDAELLEGAKTSNSAKVAKRAVTDSHNIVNRQSKSGQVTVDKEDKAHVRPKKGIAVKKAPPKKAKSKWVGWVETDSEDIDDHKQNIKAALRAGLDTEGKRMKKAHAARASEKLTKSGVVHKTSKVATGAKRRVRSDVLEDADELGRDNAK